MNKATDIIGYTYQAEQWTPSGLIAQYITKGTLDVLHANQSAEHMLNLLAAYYGIDRYDEYSFDSDDFPKVIFSSQVEDDE